MNEATAIAQQILGTFGITHGERVSNFWDPSNPTPMNLGKLWRRKDIASTRVSPRDLNVSFGD